MEHAPPSAPPVVQAHRIHFPVPQPRAVSAVPRPSACLRPSLHRGHRRTSRRRPPPALSRLHAALCAPSADRRCSFLFRSLSLSFSDLGHLPPVICGALPIVSCAFIFTLSSTLLVHMPLSSLSSINPAALYGGHVCTYDVVYVYVSVAPSFGLVSLACVARFHERRRHRWLVSVGVCVAPAAPMVMTSPHRHRTNLHVSCRHVTSSTSPPTTTKTQHPNIAFVITGKHHHHPIRRTLAWTPVVIHHSNAPLRPHPAERTAAGHRPLRAHVPQASSLPYVVTAPHGIFSAATSSPLERQIGIMSPRAR